MNEKNATSARRRTTILVLTALIAGGALGVLGMVVGQYFAQRGVQTHDHGEEGTLWTCSMHPEILAEAPGKCPICSMDLVKVDPAQREATSMSVGEANGEREILFYRNPMDATITSPVPMQDEMGMDYVPVYADQATAATVSGSAVVTLNPGMVQNMNVRTNLVERRDLRHPIRTVGYLDYDPERMVTVTTKYSGWVERVYVNYVGQPVEPGEPLFEVYSPELVQTEQEMLAAKRYAQQMGNASEDARIRAQALVDAARERLGYWDIAPEQIDQLERTGEVFRTLTVVAPAGGLVMKRMAGLGGMAIQPGMEIFHIADLSSLWLLVEVFEDQVSWVSEGTPAEIELSYFPGESFRGAVRFIEPEFDEATRTLRVQIEVPNPSGKLRKGMFATVKFDPVAVRDAVVVPQEAVLRTGQRSVVIVDQGKGRFAPQEVQIGHASEGYLEILSGLEPGQSVVTSAQFLLDSESRLREAVQKMIDSRRREGSPTERSAAPVH